MKLTPALWILGIVFTLTLSGLNARLGELNQDEGWYLYASRLVSEGQVPYRDFAFSQGPVMAYVYAAATPLIKLWGVLGGRIFTIFLGSLGLLLAVFLARRLVPTPLANTAALLTLLLTGINVFQSYFTSIVKTYSLSACFVLAGFLLLSFLKRPESTGNNKKSANANRYFWWNPGIALLAALVFSLAAGTRLSALFVIPFGFLFLLLHRKNLSLFPAACYALGTILFLSIIYLPFYKMAPESFRFWVIDYHASRLGGSPLLKASFVSFSVGAYLIPWILITLSLVAWIFAKSGTGWKETKSFVQKIASGKLSMNHSLFFALWGAVCAVTFIHIAAPFPYSDYQAFIFPLFVVSVSAASLAILASVLPSPQSAGKKSPHWVISGFLPLAIFLAVMAHSFSSPLNQNWFLAKRELIWWKTRPASPMTQLKAVAQEIKILSGKEKSLFTQDLYLAVETGLAVPAGMAMGPFSYYPDWSEEKARACHVLNREMLLETVRSSSANVAVLSEYGFAIASPGIQPVAKKVREEFLNAFEKKYRLVRNEEAFGQGNTRLGIFQKK